MAATSDDRALEQIAMAEKALKKSFFKSADPSKAAEAYEKASNIYKLDKKWEPSGNMLALAAECHAQADSTFSAARFYQNAAQTYRLGPNDIHAKSIEAYKKATDFFVEDGKFSLAAKMQKELSEVEEECGFVDDSMASLQKAIDLYISCNEPVAADQLKGKAAPMAANAGRYVDAADMFADAAKRANSPVTAADNYFKAILCILAMKDTVEASKRLNNYAVESSEFALSAEFIFLDAILQATENIDRAKFDESLKMFTKNSRNRLDGWKSKYINIARDQIPAAGDDQIL